MDLNDVEGIDFNALGGADTIVVNDLTGTDVTEVNLNLAGTLGGRRRRRSPTRSSSTAPTATTSILVVGDASGRLGARAWPRR